LAGNYATTASTAAATIPAASGGSPGDQLKVNATSNGYQLFTPTAGTGTISASARGNLGDNDKTVSGFTQDNDWHDWDISAIVRTKTTIAFFSFTQRAAAAEVQFQLRPNGNTDGSYSLARTLSSAANQYEMGVLACGTSTAGVVEYKIANGSGTFNTLSVTVIAWVG
jgi:hypothetical protein